MRDAELGQVKHGRGWRTLAASWNDSWLVPYVAGVALAGSWGPPSVGLRNDARYQAVAGMTSSEGRHSGRESQDSDACHETPSKACGLWENGERIHTFFSGRKKSENEKVSYHFTSPCDSASYRFRTASYRFRTASYRFRQGSYRFRHDSYHLRQFHTLV